MDLTFVYLGVILYITLERGKKMKRQVKTVGNMITTTNTFNIETEIPCPRCLGTGYWMFGSSCQGECYLCDGFGRKQSDNASKYWNRVEAQEQKEQKEREDIINARNKEREDTISKIRERENELSQLLEKFSNKDILKFLSSRKQQDDTIVMVSWWEDEFIQAGFNVD